MPLHQELTRFNIKHYISRKKAGRRTQILDDNYYTWSLKMKMPTIQNTHLEVEFCIVNFEVICSTQIQTLLT